MILRLEDDDPAPPGPVFPTAGLKQWFESDRGVSQSGGIATLIGDQSGNGNDATVSVSFVGARVDAAVLNGLPGLNSFYANNVGMGGAGRLLDDGSPYHLIAVAELSDTATQPGGFTYGGGLADIGSGINAVFGNYSGDLYISPSVTAPGSSALANTPYLYELLSDGVTQIARVNGVDLVLTNTTPMIPGGTGWEILGDPNGGNGPQWGFMFNWAVFDHVLSGSPLTAARGYLNTKYAL